ncbi:Uncharacterised protein [Burkholderia pseudomallei]|nr:Uncharacterised protein [Burkholderia pseudomallei]CAJ3480400.1 Uncharacterised protein [Burkholderia pseudomallei]CAJ3593416.1 Uncharacterised protein [Burkholderia pseudomallei]CAJ3643167.1 Uncharacterised protein [Burkholderia pseudomallei]CAJ3713455.1 Uncharacterised protein [Burkholderia pseudomallei]
MLFSNIKRGAGPPHDALFRVGLSANPQPPVVLQQEHAR